MIFTASFFKPETHHGALIPISRSVPSQYKALNGKHSLQALLSPSAALLKEWKKQEKQHKTTGQNFPNDEVTRQYTTQYSEEIRANKDAILQYLLQLDSTKDETWLCWEAPGEFCHRNLAYELAVKVRPDCLGGKDIEVVKPLEVAQSKCLVEVGDRVTVFNTNLTGVVREIKPAKEGAFPQALGIESYAMIELKNGIAWWKTIQLRKV